MTKEEKLEYQRKWWLKNKEKRKTYYPKEKRKEYYEKYKEKTSIKAKKYYEKNKDDLILRSKKWNEANKEHKKMKAKEYYQKNKADIKLKVKQYNKTKRNTDPLFKLKANIRTRISNLITNKGGIKKSKSIEIVGCTYLELLFHLEKQFQLWMNWDNYGLYNGSPDYGWDIDHIIPLKTAKTEEDIIRLCHYTNLQPLCSYTNRYIKKDTLVKL